MQNLLQVPQQDNKNNRQLLQYASLTAQLIAGLLAAVWVGKKLDARLHFITPLFIWVLPLIVIAILLFKIIKDTLTKN